MSFGSDQRRAIHDLAIRYNLAREPHQGVCLGLDFEPANMSVDDRDVDSRCPMVKPELVDHQCFGTTTRMTQQMLMRRTPNVQVLQGLRHAGANNPEDSRTATVPGRSSAHLIAPHQPPNCSLPRSARTVAAQVRSTVGTPLGQLRSPGV